MSDKIKIETVTGGNTEDQDDLKNCYFLPIEGNTGQYNFYDKNNNLVNTTPSTIESGTDFTFSFEDDLLESWSITDLVITGTGQHATASGNWSNNADNIANDEGSFQAAASGTLDEEEASSASA